MQLHFHESRDLRSSNKVRFLEKKYNFSDLLCVAMVAKLGDRFGKLSFHNFHARQYHRNRLTRKDRPQSGSIGESLAST
jgi:hypothetical protein